VAGLPHTADMATILFFAGFVVVVGLVAWFARRSGREIGGRHRPGDSSYLSSGGAAVGYVGDSSDGGWSGDGGSSGGSDSGGGFFGGGGDGGGGFSGGGDGGGGGGGN